jgi:hypothetical protein
MTSPKIPAFTVRAARMTVFGSRPVAAARSDVQPLAKEAAETFAAAAEIARSFAITYGYPEELLLSQMEWAEQCCTGRGPSGSPPAYSFGSPSLLGNPTSWVAISIESAGYTAETARLAREIASEQEEAGGSTSEMIRDRPDQLPGQKSKTVSHSAARGQYP